MPCFKPAAASLDFAANDLQILKFWSQKNVFKRSEERAPTKGDFVIYDGPPGTNGRPHIGHIMQSALKDLWPRFKTMQGYRVLRKAGWDTHGLPVELTAEADLKLKNKREIEQFGVAPFVEHCRKTVLRFRDDWVSAITRIGRFCDLENDYLTMSNDFIQSDWWVICQAFNKGLLYEDFKILPFCCRCGTGLSSHEVAQGYKDVTDLTLTAKFRLEEDPTTSVLAWTTTPWTLFGNVALAVGTEIEYSKVRINKDGKGEHVVLATALLEANKDALGESYEVVGTILGKDLVGKRYIPLWRPTDAWPSEGLAFEILGDEFVTTENGTGVVHLALYGEDDFRLIKKFGLKRIQHVGPDGSMNSMVEAPFKGRFFKAEGLDVDIVKDLAARGLLFDKHRYEHSYPHCWRCSTSLMYFAKSSWFIKTTAFRDQMIAENNAVTWHPPHIQAGRFGNWLENNVDWAISRDRYWGSPLNIWTSESDKSRKKVFASIRELQAAGAFLQSTGKPVPDDLDLHLPYIDDVVLKEDGHVYRREPGVLDCWFNAGVMPWGQFGYPAKPGSVEEFESQYPADFICEAIDQTRGWFYTLMAVGVLVNGKCSFKNVICTELILDAAGKKMSKSLGNVIDPVPLIEKFGADAVRWTFYQSDPWQVQRYSEELPRQALKLIFIPLWNCYSFFVTYANLDNWDPRKNEQANLSELDRWILSALKTTIIQVTDSFEKYDVASAANAIGEFTDSLSNWYIRRSRRRFWKTTDDADKQAAYRTLYEVLVSLSKILAPMAPFISETLYSNLVLGLDPTVPESVHLTEWVDAETWKAEPQLEEEMAAIQEAASLARSLRVEHNLKVRQPLSKLTLVPKHSSLIAQLKTHVDILKEEVNVREVEFAENAQDIVSVQVKPNWPKLGRKYGKIMKELAAKISSLGESELEELTSKGSICLKVSEIEVVLETSDLEMSHTAKPGLVSSSGRAVTVALATALTPELMAEGHAREFVSIVQKQRKAENFEINDTIVLRVEAEDELRRALKQHQEMICEECLVKDFSVEPLASSGVEKIDVNGLQATLSLKKA